MVKVVSLEEFYQSTFGGRPCQLNMSIYSGLNYECGCGSEHSWEPYSMPVIRELPGLKVVIANSKCDFVTFVKIKGFFKYSFESIISAGNKFKNKTKITKKKKKKIAKKQQKKKSKKK